MISGNVNQSESGIHYLTTKQVAPPRKLFPGWTIVNSYTRFLCITPNYVNLILVLVILVEYMSIVD